MFKPPLNDVINQVFYGHTMIRKPVFNNDRRILNYFSLYHFYVFQIAQFFGQG
jgi:hypothetical protein